MTHRKHPAGPERKEATRLRNAGRVSKGRKSTRHAAGLAAAAPCYRVWLVEQNVTGLFGEYLTEAMVLARTAKDALNAASSLADSRAGFGLVVQRGRLRAIDYGPAPEPLPAVCPRHRYRDALVLVVGTGSDDGGLPAVHDYDEDL
jgi:hypothetical protein